MTLPQPFAAPDRHRGTAAAKRALANLQASLEQISAQTQTAALRPLIEESLLNCHELRRYFDQANGSAASDDPVVDLQIFERLMALAGPDTAQELLDQMHADLLSGYEAIQAAMPRQDRMALRGQCHMLIAVAGAVGAKLVQGYAEQVHEAALNMEADTDMLPAKVGQLQTALQALLLFVKSERQARAAP